MQKLAEICIRRPVFASMLILALVVIGVAGYFQLGVDRFPAVDLPVVAALHERLAAEAGFAASFTTRPGYIAPARGMHGLPRGSWGRRNR
jgi:multidrug efflux pump subunit AcrB